MEYISREEIEKAKDETIHGKCVPDVWFSAFVKKIDAIPAADVAPVCRGKWMNPHQSRVKANVMVFDCSECGYVSEYQTPHCPMCGAKME